MTMFKYQNYFILHIDILSINYNFMVFCMAYFFTTFQSASLDYFSLFVESDPKDVVIQGSRVSVSSPWTTDDGQPLPFVGEFQGISNLAGTLRIIFTSSGKWASVNPTNVFPNAVCEIPVWQYIPFSPNVESEFHFSWKCKNMK